MSPRVIRESSNVILFRYSKRVAPMHRLISIHLQCMLYTAHSRRIFIMSPPIS